MSANGPVKIAWHGKHFGEEPPLVGEPNQGAGAIFFSGCNLRCVFCQNHQISQGDVGKNVYVGDLAKIMLDLQKSGAINIDLVTPTIWWRQIKEAIFLAKRAGLKIPIVWNSNAYESSSIIKEMNGLVDIYLPDFKYADDELALKYSSVPNYLKISKQCIAEMLKQVGHLQIENGLCKKGLIVRHLILPNNIENSLRVLAVLTSIDKNIHISLMNQYHPMHEAKKFSELNRPLNRNEFEKVYNRLLELGFENGWVQEEESSECYLPNFAKQKPFNI